MSRRTHNWKPAVGEKVKLSHHGWSSLKPDSPEMAEQARSMTITRVENLGYDHKPIWSVSVDALLINEFLLDATMFEPL